MLDRNFNNPSLKEIKQHYETKYVKEFKRIIDTWNNRIRSFIKQSMGVSLSFEKEERHSINIEVLPAHNQNFFDLIEDEFSNLDFDELYFLTNLLNEIKYSKPYIIKTKGEPSLKKLEDFIKERLKEYDLSFIIGKLFSFLKPKDDIIGNYDPHAGQVNIYVAPIVILSKLTKIKQESLIIITLAHELAHAHSHLGRDKDGHFWVNFEDSDMYLAEGVAQYYTERFVRKFKDVNSNLQINFKELLKMQPHQYNIHTVWDANFEQVASALIQVRRKKQVNYQDFEMGLKDAKKRIV